MRRFRDRTDAGRRLAAAVVAAGVVPPVTVLALPRGGVVVAAEIAATLHAPLDVLIVRKVGLPWQPEFALGAIASGGIVLEDPAAARMLRGSGSSFESLALRERAELERRESLYRRELRPLPLHAATVVIVDDGAATGSTMLVAIRAARAAGAARVVAAYAVASSEAHERIAAEADQAIVLATPAFFSSVGEWYEDFSQVEDDEVRRLLAEAARHRAPAQGA